MTHVSAPTEEKREIPTPVPSGLGKNRLTWIIPGITAVVVALGGLFYFVQSNKVAVPDLIGISLDEAVARLGTGAPQARDCKTHAVRPRAGTVIEQDPAPGSQLSPESPVNLALAEKKLEKLWYPISSVSPSTKPLRAWGGNT